MARRPCIVGNWKLHLTIAEGTALAKGVAAVVPARVDAAVCPTFVALASVAAAVAGTPLRVGGQDCHWDEKGAFTGEVSASFLKDAGASYVVLGHSERRQYFGETDATVNKRLRAALAQGLTPIVCVGETLAERDAGQASLERVLRTQVLGATAGLSAADLAPLVIAYEPVWAIGTGRTASSAQAQDAHAFIRSVVRGAFAGLADQVRIQYGGSVKPDNAKELLGQPDVDGALVGGASLKLADFAAILAAAP
jgi:triosephosphate isomerase (TIM)